MITLSKDVIEGILKHLTDRLAMAILFLSVIFALVSLIPGTVGVWASSHWPYWLIGGLGAVCYLPTGHILKWADEKIAGGKKEKRLHKLTKGEKDLLRPYINNGYRSRRLDVSDPVAKGLSDDGILYAPNVPLDRNGQQAYNILDWVADYFETNPELLS